MGIPAAEIDQWPESELQRYIRYSNRHALPQRRLELYLAQAAHVSAVTMGGYKGNMSAFVLFDPPDSDTVAGGDADASLAAATELMMAGFNPE